MNRWEWYVPILITMAVLVLVFFLLEGYVKKLRSLGMSSVIACALCLLRLSAPAFFSHVLSEQETLEKMVGFVISELEQSNCNNEMGYKRLAGFHLGEAAHPLMDLTCPAHPLRPWEGMFPEYVPHAVDLKISDRKLRDTANFTRDTLDQLIPIHNALSG